MAKNKSNKAILVLESPWQLGKVRISGEILLG